MTINLLIFSTNMNYSPDPNYTVDPHFFDSQPLHNDEKTEREIVGGNNKIEV